MDNENDIKILQIIKLFASISGRHNILPKDTDPKDTYQWRYAASFVRMTEEYGISWKSIRSMIYYIVEHVREHKALWHKGLWVLTRKDIIDICFKKMKAHEDVRKVELELIKRSYEFARGQSFDFESEVRPGAFCNLVSWYQAGHLDVTYIAMSESCYRALKNISEVDKMALPQDRITDRRVFCFINPDFARQIQSILGDDFIRIAS